MSFQLPDLTLADTVSSVLGTLVTLGFTYHQLQTKKDLREVRKVVKKSTGSAALIRTHSADMLGVERLRRALKNFAVHSFFGEQVDNEATSRLTEGTNFFGAVPKASSEKRMGWLFRLTSGLETGALPVDVVEEVREIARRYLKSTTSLPALRIVVLSPTGPAYGVSSSLDEQIRDAILHECSKAKEAPETKAIYANAHIVNDMAGKLQFTIQTVASLANIFDRTSTKDFARKYEPSNHG